MRPIQIACTLMLLSFYTILAAPHTDLTKALAVAKAQGKPGFDYVYDSI